MGWDGMRGLGVGEAWDGMGWDGMGLGGGDVVRSYHCRLFELEGKGDCDGGGGYKVFMYSAGLESDNMHRSGPSFVLFE